MLVAKPMPLKFSTGACAHLKWPRKEIPDISWRPVSDFVRHNQAWQVQREECWCSGMLTITFLSCLLRNIVATYHCSGRGEGGDLSRKAKDSHIWRPLYLVFVSISHKSHTTDKVSKKLLMINKWPHILNAAEDDRRWASPDWAEDSPGPGGAVGTRGEESKGPMLLWPQ